MRAGAGVEDVRRLLNQKSLTATASYIHRSDERLQGLAACVKKPELVTKFELVVGGRIRGE
ncbi:MAG: hypothetical protein AAB425_13765 [Bdellovibrionota bacterium]